jgi:FAD synthase
MQCSMDYNSLPCGIYWGFAKISSKNGGEEALVYKAAISIGYNPYFKNEEKTVEPHLIAPPDDDSRHASTCGETLLGDFYDDNIRLSVVGFLRDELPFDGLDKLVAAIKNDINNSESLCDSTNDETTTREKNWVDSKEAF